MLGNFEKRNLPYPVYSMFLHVIQVRFWAYCNHIDQYAFLEPPPPPSTYEEMGGRTCHDAHSDYSNIDSALPHALYESLYLRA